MQQRGFTLIELMVSLVILAILLQGASSFVNHLLPQSRLTADTNHVIGLLTRARHHALFQDQVMVCALNSQCQHFKEETGLILIADQNRNHQFDAQDTVLEKLTLHQQTHISWHSFRNLPALTYYRNGLAHFQNGHYLICNKQVEKKIVMNRIGRQRN